MRSGIFWLTGQSGAGKTSLVNELKWRNEFINLDGDEMRECWDIGFSREDRTKHNLRIAKLAKVLARQSDIVVSVIAPIASVREEITKICNPVWVYVKRTLHRRPGHFYEEPEGYHTLDHDKLTVADSVVELEKIFKGE